MDLGVLNDVQIYMGDPKRFGPIIWVSSFYFVEGKKWIRTIIQIHIGKDLFFEIAKAKRLKGEKNER